MTTDIIQGIIAILLVGTLGAIALLDLLLNRPFTEPATLAALAGVAVTYYFGQRQARRQQEQIATLTDKLAESAPVHPNGGSN